MARAGVEAGWGGSVTRVRPDLKPGDDPNAHVIAGDIMSPDNTEDAITLMLGWISGIL